MVVGNAVWLSALNMKTARIRAGNMPADISAAKFNKPNFPIFADSRPFGEI